MIKSNAAPHRLPPGLVQPSIPAAIRLRSEYACTGLWLWTPTSEQGRLLYRWSQEIAVWSKRGDKLARDARGLADSSYLRCP